MRKILSNKIPVVPRIARKLDCCAKSSVNRKLCGLVRTLSANSNFAWRICSPSSKFFGRFICTDVFFVCPGFTEIKLFDVRMFLSSRRILSSCK